MGLGTTGRAATDSGTAGVIKPKLSFDIIILVVSFSQVKFHSLKTRADKARGRGGPGRKREFRQRQKEIIFKDAGQGLVTSARRGGRANRAKVWTERTGLRDWQGGRRSERGNLKGWSTVGPMSPCFWISQGYRCCSFTDYPVSTTKLRGTRLNHSSAKHNSRWQDLFPIIRKILDKALRTQNFFWHDFQKTKMFAKK